MIRHDTLLRIERDASHCRAPHPRSLAAGGVVRRILDHLGLPTDPPLITPARAAPEPDYADNFYDENA